MEHKARSSSRLPGCIAALGLFVYGCAGPVTTPDRDVGPVAGLDYMFIAVDVPSERRFKLVLESNSRRQLCTGSSEGPTAASVIQSASARAYVVVDEQRFPYRDFIMDACPWKACGRPMDEGARFESSLFYQQFALPETFYGATKVLEYRPRPFWCDTGRWIIEAKRPR